MIVIECWPVWFKVLFESESKFKGDFLGGSVSSDCLIEGPKINVTPIPEDRASSGNLNALSKEWEGSQEGTLARTVRPYQEREWAKFDDSCISEAPQILDAYVV